MSLRPLLKIILLLSLILTASCSPNAPVPDSQGGSQHPPTSTSDQTLVENTPIPSPSGTAIPSPTPTPSFTPTRTTTPFPFGEDLTITYLRRMQISGSEIIIEEQLSNGATYRRYLASYLSQGNRIYGLLTMPFGDPPQGGFKAVVFNHGYIPPDSYKTLERYEAYLDYLARSGFVVFKIDYRGHGQSEGYPSGSYFSPGYTIDAISALKSLQTFDGIDPDGIGMWGHSMGGNLVLRAMLVEPNIKAGVIFAGAVYSYMDLLKYGIWDTSYRPPATPAANSGGERLTSSRIIFETYGLPDGESSFWQAISLTENLAYLSNPIQIHHAENDQVVNIGYSFDLAAQLQIQGKPYEFYIYEGGGHNIISPYFDQAMQRTVQFFLDNL